MHLFRWLAKGVDEKVVVVAPESPFSYLYIVEDFRGFLLNISKMVQLIFTKLMSSLGNYV